MEFILPFFITLLISTSCKREGNCDCVPPPVTESNWKITRIFGGFAPAEKELSDDQKNSVLTINSRGAYTCKNAVTGISTSGVIYREELSGGLIKYTFDPSLRIYPVPAFHVIEQTNTRMILSDRNADGYQVTFQLQ